MFISKIITADESWIHSFKPESKQTELCVEVSFVTNTKEDENGSSAGCTELGARITVTRNVLKLLRIHPKSQQFKATGWMLHIDKWRLHVANLVDKYLLKISIMYALYLQYSSDLDPYEYFLLRI
ncbi:hypothetical protein CDAR_212871 [Caerostris darwini]|uniref:Uncharacterized protein n=1 Tax=Caerostris darwini TaxID=1538125 RepID=A0AAV4MEC3_9ARAC|nr:hypothetical protein CDAR_212871 [Caerostris darwini]